MGKVVYEVDGHVATLTIDSPPANALSSILLEDLDRHLNTIEEDQTIKAVILKGEGRFFSAGADINEFLELEEASEYQTLAEKGQQLFNRIEHFHIPVIAAIHGAALGGGLELAMACHMRIATEDAHIGLPETTLGIIPGFAGTQRLPQYVGLAKAYEMILSGEAVRGQEAFQFGLINKVTSDEEVFTEAEKLANKIAEKSKPSIERIMKLIPYAKTAQFQEGVQAEAKKFGEVFMTEDAQEGIKAFTEKRKPNFNDK